MVQEYVIDASALIQGYILETDSVRVRTLLGRLFDADPVTLHVPEFCLVECINALWKKVVFDGEPPSARSSPPTSDRLRLRLPPA